MGLGSGIKKVAARARAIDGDVVKILTEIVDSYSDGNISKAVCEQIAKNIGKVYKSHNGQPLRNINFKIDNKRMVAEVHFQSVDIPVTTHRSTNAFTY